MATARLPFVWNCNLDEGAFRALLEGRQIVGRLHRDWAAGRLLEYASWPEIRRLLRLRELAAGWPSWRGRIRSQSRQRGVDFLDWLPPRAPGSSVGLVDHSHFLDWLYPLQDAVLRVLSAAETGFYPSGGTAASRGYLQHRFSEELDLFANDDASFGLWTARSIDRLVPRSEWCTRVLLREARFACLEVTSGETLLKVEMVNDVPAHIGSGTVHPQLGRLDSPEDILANKLMALVDRDESKDGRRLGFLLPPRPAPLAGSGRREQQDGRPLPAGSRSRPAQRVQGRHGPHPLDRSSDPDAFLADLRRLGEELALLPPPR
jgi:hypothetical protein